MSFCRLFLFVLFCYKLLLVTNKQLSVFDCVVSFSHIFSFLLNLITPQKKSTENLFQSHGQKSRFFYSRSTDLDRQLSQKGSGQKIKTILIISGFLSFLYLLNLVTHKFFHFLNGDYTEKITKFMSRPKHLFFYPHLIRTPALLL